MLTGTSWDVMLDSFKDMVSSLYKRWKWYLWDSLEPEDQNGFQSFIDEKASHAKLRASLKRLSSFLAKKSGRQVIVLIDEYEAPNNYAYEYGFYKEVRPLRPPQLYSRLTTFDPG